MAVSIEELQLRLREFASERDWHQFHTPKNLAMALSGEVGEVCALLQWVEADNVPAWMENPDNAKAMRHEIADVFAYLIQLAESLGIDPGQALLEKIAVNGEKYPVALSKGSSAKYTELRNAAE